MTGFMRITKKNIYNYCCQGTHLFKDRAYSVDGSSEMLKVGTLDCQLANLAPTSLAV